MLILFPFLYCLFLVLAYYRCLFLPFGPFAFRTIPFLFCEVGLVNAIV